MSETYLKKIYRIKINETIRSNGMWYKEHKGKEFDTFLMARDKKNRNSQKAVAFAVDYLHIVHPIDCVIVGEREEANYFR